MLSGGACELPAYCERCRTPPDWSPGLARILPAVHTDHADLRKLKVPVCRYSVKDQAEIAALPWLYRRRRDWLGIDVRLAGAYEAEREGHSLGKLAYITVKANLDGNRGQRSVPAVNDLAVDVGDFGPGKAGSLAHLQTADGELGGIGVGRSHPRAGSGGLRVGAASNHDQNAKAQDGHHSSNNPGQPRDRFATLVRSKETWIFVLSRHKSRLYLPSLTSVRGDEPR